MVVPASFLTAFSARKLKADTEMKSRRGADFLRGIRVFSFIYLCFCTSHLAARCTARVARCPRPRHARTCLIYCSRHSSSRAPHRYSVPQPQAAEQPFKPSAPPRRHCQRPQLVKGKSPQGSRVTVQIEQYLLCSAAQLTSCSSPAATAVQTVSAAAKTLPTTPTRER